MPHRGSLPLCGSAARKGQALYEEGKEGVEVC